jgi:hypothetical protein
MSSHSYQFTNCLPFSLLASALALTSEIHFREEQQQQQQHRLAWVVCVDVSDDWRRVY